MAPGAAREVVGLLREVVVEAIDRMRFLDRTGSGSRFGLPKRTQGVIGES